MSRIERFAQVRAMIIRPDSIELSRDAVDPREIIGSPLTILPGCAVAGCLLFSDEYAIYKGDLRMNELANPLVIEDYLFRMSMLGKPLGTIVLTRDDEKSPLPLSEIKKLYKLYDEKVCSHE